MPIPLKPNNYQSNYQFDASFLAPSITVPNTDDKKIVTASDRDANLLMKICQYETVH